MPYFIGVDVGSVSTKLVVIDDEGEINFETYLRTEGGPIQAIQKAFRQLEEAKGEIEVAGVGTTGSGRRLAGIMIGADLIKNEITAHATAARWVQPDVRTVIDIGGQDSKIIFFQNGVPVGFNMNTVCAAGTGSFLDHQATRLGIPIEEFGEYALRSRSPIKIAGRCGVFAESDLIHKQQMGYKKEDLIAGLCLALATNFLTNVARGRKIEPVVLFQGGVAANIGMRAAFQKKLGLEVVVPPHFKVMGAWGAALLAKRNYERRHKPSNFRGVNQIASFSCTPRTFICGDCANNCEINEVYIGGELVSRWGSRCGKWNNLNLPSDNRQENRWDSGLSLSHG
ncbi:acyl-CoA dehydratase activase [Desulfothermobacter acidiphilus]|uniref:acyl-CoA dehydratase activase n=1 Tax=Desulfothermobacter acidiphilus TaxID=1938353 RepID=UPI003F8C7673